MMLLLAGSLAAVTGCSSEKEDKQGETKKEAEKKEYYNGELSEEEMNDTHLSLELMENVTVDADITSLEYYKEGLASYFIQKPDAKKLVPDKPKIGGKGDIPKEYKKVRQAISDNMAETLDVKKEKSDFQKKKWLRVSVPFDNPDTTFAYTLDLDKKSRPCGKDISVSRGYKAQEGEEISYYISDFDVATMLLIKDIDFDQSDLSFGSREEIAGKAKEQVEDLIGRKISDTYDSAVINEETYDLVTQTDLFSEQYIECDADFYAYFFYEDINGFPWKNAYAQWELEEGAVCAGDVDVDSEYAFPLNPGELEVSYGKDGMREIFLSNTAEVSTEYKKNDIILLDDLLIKIGDYYAANRSGTLLSNTIYEIKLCYISTISDAKDGKIRNIVKPYWGVKIWQKHADGRESINLFFDVETGEYKQY